MLYRRPLFLSFFSADYVYNQNNYNRSTYSMYQYLYFITSVAIHFDNFVLNDIRYPTVSVTQQVVMK